MIADNSFPESLLNIAEEHKITATQKVQKIQLIAQRADRIQKLWEGINKFLRNNWPLHLLALIDKEKSLLKEIEDENNIDIESLNNIYEIAVEKVAQIKFYIFPAELEKACLAANLPLDRDAPHPNYGFERGFFKLHIDEHKKTARLSNPESQKLFEIPADIGAIIEAIQREHTRIFDRPFDSKKFLKKLRTNYLAVIKADKLKDGDSIPIRSITRRLGKNEKGFRTDEFLIDLSRLIDKGVLEINGWKIDFQQTKDTTQGMYLQIEPKRYVSLILFKKA